jgi:hypothetical protein
MQTAPSFRISRLLWAVTWLEVVILTWAGLGLLFYPPVIESFWPWPLAPFNLRYLGALYSAALIAAFMQAYSGGWSPARVVTPMIFIFTLVVSIFSVVHLDRFDPGRAETWIWFILYFGVCLNAGAHLWLYRARPVPEPAIHVGHALRWMLLGLVAVLGTYGLLLLTSTEAARFWPWKLDDFHARMYSVTFLTPALGAWVLARGATRLDLLTLGLTLAAWGALPILGLVIADHATQRVAWAASGTWLWLALFAAMTLAGVALLLSARGAGSSRPGVDQHPHL